MSFDDKRDAISATFLAPAATLVLVRLLLDVLHILLDDLGGGDKLHVALGGRGSLVGRTPVAAAAAAAVEQRQVLLPAVLRLPAHAARRDEDGGQQSHRRQRRRLPEQRRRRGTAGHERPPPAPQPRRHGLLRGGLLGGGVDALLLVAVVVARGKEVPRRYADERRTVARSAATTTVTQPRATLSNVRRGRRVGVDGLPLFRGGPLGRPVVPPLRLVRQLGRHEGSLRRLLPVLECRGDQAEF